MSEIHFYFTVGEIQEISAYGKLKFTKANKLAIHAVDDLTFGEMRQFEVYREEKGTSLPRVFRIEQEAIEWLNS